MTDPVSLTPAYISAQAVAMNARCGSCDDHMVEDMRIKAEELLPYGHPMRLEITMFATQYENLRRDFYAVKILGEALEKGLHQALNIKTHKPQWQGNYD